MFSCFVSHVTSVETLDEVSIYDGLSAREVGQFVFEYAEGWRDKKMTGTEWLTDHKTLSVLKPETAIINRAR
jgi:hypothetical protein